MTALNPMTISSQNVPPAFSGYPVETEDKSFWKVHAEKEAELLKELFHDFKSWVMEKGGPELKYSNIPFWQTYSPYANLYNYPKELSFTHIRPDPPNWFGFDAFVRIEPGSFDIPEKLAHLGGKLIFFTMGTLACYELGLMKKLLDILSKSPHRFIFALGKKVRPVSLPLKRILKIPNNINLFRLNLIFVR